MLREYTIKVMDLLDENLIDAERLALELLAFLSEEEVKRFWATNNLGDYEK